MKIKTTKLAALLLLMVFAMGGNFASAQEQTAKVTIIKYIDGAKATATSANNTSFAMNSNWNASNLGAPGGGTYNLSASGFGGDPTPYQAVTAAMATGASYSTSEIKDGTVVGASCATFRATGKPKFALAGYSSGDTLAQAQAGAKTAVAPSFTNLTSDKYV